MKFNRSIQSIILGTFLPIIIFFITVILSEIAKVNIYEDEVTLTPTGVNFLIMFFLFGVLFVLLKSIVPPDFKYFINIADDCIIFEMNENDHRRIGRDFKIVSKKMHYIILDDGFSRIRIAYNRKVLQFLEEINK